MNFIARKIDGELYVSMDQVNRAIEEKNAEIESIKAENERLKEANHELQVDLEGAKATAYADSVDAGMRERRLRRALHKACANWAKSFKTTAELFGAHVDAVKWDNMERECRAKAKEYK